MIGRGSIYILVNLAQPSDRGSYGDLGTCIFQRFMVYECLLSSSTIFHQYGELPDLLCVGKHRHI